ncbi:hypothetical protein [Halosimplex salinum]|uniref:hypothetical protein n=1 Tax=Halosimplex salinum TaxID=1710538 RepID=UPI0013DE31CA|nr:hypothetical protein [Halosimplex salinum]
MSESADANEADARESREVLAEALCARSRKILAVFTIAVVFLFLQLPYLVVVEQDSSLFVVAVLNVIGSSAFALASGSVLWFCREREM